MNQEHSRFKRPRRARQSAQDRIRLGSGAVAVLALLLLSISLLMPSQSTSLRVVLESSEPGVLQAYYDMGESFREDLTARASHHSGVSKLTLSMPAGTLKAIRLDPSPGLREIRIKSVSIESPRLGSRVMVPVETIVAVHQSQKIGSDSSGAKFEIQDRADDPQLLVALQSPVPIAEDDAAYTRAKNLLLLSILLCAVLTLCLSRPASAMAPWLLVPLVLIAAMATTTTTARSIHPDEHSHVFSARYYLSNWLPPGAEDERIEETYTPYGTSYLNELDVVYFFAAKASSAWSHLTLDEAMALRWFNVMLFAVLIAFSWRSRQLWPGSALLLMTPQIWYVFSYFNGDAFSLFLSFLLVFLCAAPASRVSSFIESGRERGGANWLVVALFVAALGLLLVSKRNYLPVIFVLGLFLSVRHLRLPLWAAVAAAAGAALFVFRYAASLNADGISERTVAAIVPLAIALFLVAGAGLIGPVLRDSSLRPKFFRLISLFIVACAIAFPRYAIDRHVNGDSENKRHVLQAMAEKHAVPGLKPSAIAKGEGISLPGNNLAKKGVGYFELFVDDRDWARISLESMLGVYGYMEFSALPLIYYSISFGLLLCFLRLLWQWRLEPQSRPYFVVGLCGVALTIFSSTVFSWVVDFQPQGRYLLPSISILAAMLIANPSLSRSRTISCAVVVCFSASVCSFIFYAIPPLIAK